MDGDGTKFIDIQNQIRQEVIVPDPHDFQNADRNEGRLHHGQDDPKEGLYSVAAINHSRFFNGTRNGLDKAREHKHSKAGTEAEVDNGDRPRTVEFQSIGGLCQCEHDHLERNNHGEHAQIIHNAADKAVDA